MVWLQFLQKATVNRRLRLKELRKARLNPRALNYSQRKEKQLLLERKVKFCVYRKACPSIFLTARLPQWVRYRDHIQTHNTRWDSSGRVIGRSQKPLPDYTQQSQQTDIHAPGGIRTHNLSRRAAADPRLRPRGHWDQKRVYLKVIWK